MEEQTVKSHIHCRCMSNDCASNHYMNCSFCGNKRETSQSEADSIYKKIENALFISKEEDDSIEHVDMSYKAFMELIDRLRKLANK